MYEVHAKILPTGVRYFHSFDAAYHHATKILGLTKRSYKIVSPKNPQGN